MSWSGGNGVDGVWVELELKKIHNGGGVELKWKPVEVEEEISNLGTLFENKKIIFKFNWCFINIMQKWISI